MRGVDAASRNNNRLDFETDSLKVFTDTVEQHSLRLCEYDFIKVFVERADKPSTFHFSVAVSDPHADEANNIFTNKPRGL